MTTTSAPPRYLLRWTDPNGAPAERELPQGELTIGRDPASGLVLGDPRVSRQHARIRVDGDAITIQDLGSRNGTLVDGERVDSADLEADDKITVGGLVLTLIDRAPPPSRAAAERESGTVALDPEDRPTLGLAGTEALPRDAVPSALRPEPALEAGPVVSDAMLARPFISERELAAAGVEVKVAEYAALGGGLGSFVWADLLRNSGVPASEIVVVGNEEHPHSRYERLCRDSQIPRHERLRSDSGSCPENLWGFPGYATREAWRELTRGNVQLAASALWSIFGEPAIAQTYTPRSGQVFAAIEKEEVRIGWRQMLRFGRIRNLRKSEEGRLVAIISESDERRRKHAAVSARFMHLAIGYPAIQLLPDLAEYRETYGDRSKVVNAYEHHDHVYEQLRQRGGTVLIRGRGIVASRIIQRLWEERQHNKGINVIHLHRSRLTAGHRYGLARRVVEEQWEYQPFNWPKGCWGGEPLEIMERAPDEERRRLLEIWGGTTTARRSDWRRMIREGTQEGWYRSEFGIVEDVKPGAAGAVVTRIKSNLPGGGMLELRADFVIDCTGLIAKPDRSPLLADLIKTYNLPPGPVGRLKITNNYEVEGMRHGESRLHAAGALTLGGPLGAVDSFLGLQFSAMRAVDDIRDLRPKGYRRLNGLYSLAQWTKWVRGAAP